MPVRHINHRTLGDVSVYKRKGMKGLRISLPHNGVVRVSIPKWMPYQAGLKYAEAKADWITVNRPATISNVERDNLYEYLMKHSYKLEDRIRDLSKETGLEFNSLRIKKLMSRWGSCSSKKNINLNGFLLQLPQELIDYVLVHELSHTKHQNHGLEFWNEVSRHMPDYRSRREQLRSYRPGFKL